VELLYYELIHGMETLPPELIIHIVTKLRVGDCLNLIESDSSYEWLRRDKSLWKHLAWRDLKYPPGLFEFRLASDIPADLYRELSRCHHLMPISGTRFFEPCRNPIFPGTSFCRSHCVSHDIKICPSCDQGFVELNRQNVSDRFCPACWTINPTTQQPRWKGECQYNLADGHFSFRLRVPGESAQCGAKRQPGSNYCNDCQRKADYIKSITPNSTAPRHTWNSQTGADSAVESNSNSDDEQVDEPVDETLAVAETKIPDHYVIVSGPLTGIVVRSSVGAITAIGRAPPDVLVSQLDRIDNLAPLTELDRRLAPELGLTLREILD
jgi:hypothetical protein